MISHQTLSDDNLWQNDDKCPTFKDEDRMTKVLALGVLVLFPTSGHMWIIDIIERFTGRVISGSFMNVGNQRMYSKYTNHSKSHFLFNTANHFLLVFGISKQRNCNRQWRGVAMEWILHSSI